VSSGSVAGYRIRIRISDSDSGGLTTAAPLMGIGIINFIIFMIGASNDMAICDSACACNRSI
jgi:hypothetical protein